MPLHSLGTTFILAPSAGGLGAPPANNPPLDGPVKSPSCQENTFGALKGMKGGKEGSRQEMYDKFQPWVLSTYGDSAKTKTITRKKATRSDGH